MQSNYIDDLEAYLLGPVPDIHPTITIQRDYLGFERVLYNYIPVWYGTVPTHGRIAAYIHALNPHLRIQTTTTTLMED